MATVFEMRTHYKDRAYAGKATRAAFDELDRLESQLSRFINTGDISRINNLRPGQSAHVGRDSFECLQLCERLFNQTSGAFDIAYLSKTTGSQLRLKKKQFAVSQPDEKAIIDLGGIGKGFAIDKMVQLLCEWGIESFLLDAGHSTIYASGAPPGKNGFALTIKSPLDNKIISDLQLKNRAVSCSSTQIKSHIIDPQTKITVKDKIAAWVCAPDAATADAISTAFMVMPPLKIERYCREHPHIAAIILLKENKRTPQRILSFGHWKQILT